MDVGKKYNRLRWKSVMHILKVTFQGFLDDNVMKLSASLAYATIFALVPFITIIITLGTFFHRDIASQLYGQMNEFLGEEVVLQLQHIIRNASLSNNSSFTAILGFGIMLFGASAIFAEMQTSLNIIWGIKPKPKRGWLMFLKNRVLSFSMILIIGFLLLITFSISSIIAGLNNRLIAYFPDAALIFFKIFGVVLNFVVITVLFMLMFKMLPDAKIKSKDVFIGALVTTFLFLVGQYGISFYMATRNITSVYGAAAFLIVLLTWIYYSSVIIYIGAEFTKSWANELGGKIFPDTYAVSTRIIEVHEDKPIETINKTQLDKSDDNTGS